MNQLRAFVRLVKWEWIREAKRFDAILSMILFAMIALMIFSFAIDPSSETGERVRAGMLWIILLLAGAIGIDRSFRGDGAEKVLQGLLLAPISRITLYYAKVFSTLLFVLVMEAIVVAVFLLLYNVKLPDPAGLAIGRLAVVIALGTLGYVAVGVTLSAMTRTIKGGEVLLRILLFPLMIPVFAAVVEATRFAFAGETLTVKQLGLVIAFDLIYLAAGQILFEVILADYDSN